MWFFLDEKITNHSKTINHVIISSFYSNKYQVNPKVKKGLTEG